MTNSRPRADRHCERLPCPYVVRMDLRLASYNIHKCVGSDRRRRPDRILSTLSDLGADVLVLQEVDHRLGARHAALRHDLIVDATGLRVLPFALGLHSLGWHGQTILARPHLGLHDLERIDLPGLEPRGALLAELSSLHGRVRIVGVHLGLIGRYRRLQLQAIAAAIAARPPMPTVIIGDFNEWSMRAGAAALGTGFRLHVPGPTFPTPRPVARLDRLAIGPNVHLTDAGVWQNGMARLASDHLPIWADLSFSEAG